MRLTCTTLISICLLLLVTGCAEETPEHILERYAERVASSLDQDARLDLSQPPDIRPLPRRRTRLLATEEVRQGLLEVLNLHHCKLLPLIAQRNSSLGRVMLPSQQLIYEVKLYQGLRTCQQHLADSPLDADEIIQIREIWAIKQRNFPIVVWNALYASEEMERNFSLAEPALPLRGEDGFSGTMDALQHFTQLAALAYNQAEWPLPEFLDRLEDDYQALYNNRYGSRCQRSFFHPTRTLDHTAQLIERRLQQRPLCFRQQTNPQANILNSVFHKYYAGEVQPYLSKLDRQGQRWLSEQATLLAHFAPLLPRTMQDYQQQVLSLTHPDALWPRYLTARNRHTQAWQQILMQCNLMPTD